MWLCMWGCGRGGAKTARIAGAVGEMPGPPRRRSCTETRPLPTCRHGTGKSHRELEKNGAADLNR